MCGFLCLFTLFVGNRKNSLIFNFEDFFVFQIGLLYFREVKITSIFKNDREKQT